MVHFTSALASAVLLLGSALAGPIDQADAPDIEARMINYGWHFIGIDEDTGFQYGGDQNFNTDNCVKFTGKYDNSMTAIRISQTVARCFFFDQGACHDNPGLTLNVERTNGNNGMDRQYFQFPPSWQHRISAMKCSY